MELNSVICETPDQFRAEVEKWQKKGAAPIIRGRKLIAYGDTVAVYAPKRGGVRPGAGRPSIGNSKAVSLRISEEAKAILDLQTNKNAFVTAAIISYASER